MIIEVLNIIFDLFPEILLASGPFAIFKGMGSGSQSGNLFFRTAAGGTGMTVSDSGNAICIKDEALAIAQGIGLEAVIIGDSGCSVKSSINFIAQAQLSSHYKRGINLPTIGNRKDFAETNTNCGWQSGNIIVSGKNNLIGCGYYSGSSLYKTHRNTIINSFGSIISSKQESSYPTRSQSSDVKHSTIISGSNSIINYYSSYSSIIAGCNTCIFKNKSSNAIATQNSCISGYKSGGKWVYQSIGEAANYNFISGHSNTIYSWGGQNFGYWLKYGQGDNLDLSKETILSRGSSIITGRTNTISGSFFSSIMSGNGNYINGAEITPYGDKNQFKKYKTRFNLIGSGCKNKISSYTGYYEGPLNRYADGKYRYQSKYQSIINGQCNVIRNSHSSSIVNGLKNKIYSGSKSAYNQDNCENWNIAIINGKCNYSYRSPRSAILNGVFNKTDGGKSTGARSGNTIINGCENCTSSSQYSLIVSGCNNSITLGKFTTIVSGTCHSITYGHCSTIIGGTNSSTNAPNSTIDSSGSCIVGVYWINQQTSEKSFRTRHGSIIGGNGNKIYSSVLNSGLQVGLNIYSFISGSNNTISQCFNYSLLANNSVTDTQLRRTSILGGFNSSILSHTFVFGSSIFGGKSTILNSRNSSILGGSSNKIGATSSNNQTYNGQMRISSIIGGSDNSNIISNTINNSSYISRMNLIIGGCKNQFVIGTTGSSVQTSRQKNLIIGGCKLYSCIYSCNCFTNTKGRCYDDLTLIENLSLRGFAYANDCSNNKCKGISLLLSKTISSICVVRGLVITMSYAP